MGTNTLLFQLQGNVVTSKIRNLKTLKILEGRKVGAISFVQPYFAYKITTTKVTSVTIHCRIIPVSFFGQQSRDYTVSHPVRGIIFVFQTCALLERSYPGNECPEPVIE